MNVRTTITHTHIHAHAEHQLLEKKGKIVFVDLAGSERLRDTGTKGKVTVWRVCIFVGVSFGLESVALCVYVCVPVCLSYLSV